MSKTFLMCTSRLPLVRFFRGKSWSRHLIRKKTVFLGKIMLHIPWFLTYQTTALKVSYNNILTGNFVPLEWKMQTIFPIPKSGKGLDSLTGWCTTTLSSCVGKVLECMIKNRLDWVRENKGLLYSYQSGFRRGRCATDNHAVLYWIVSTSLASEKTVVVILLDIKSAYDNVLIPKLYECAL